MFMKLSDLLYIFFIGQEVFAVLLCNLLLGWSCCVHEIV